MHRAAVLVHAGEEEEEERQNARVTWIVETEAAVRGTNTSTGVLRIFVSRRKPGPVFFPRTRILSGGEQDIFLTLFI